MSNEIPEYEAIPVDEKDKPMRTSMPRRPTDLIDEVVNTARDIATKIPETIGRTIEKVIQTGENTLLIRLDHETSESLDMLVKAGVFKNRSEAASFLLTEGVKSQQTLFGQVKEKAAEIERLQSELRHIAAE